MNMFLHFSVSRVHSLLGLLIQLVAVFATLDKIFQNIGIELSLKYFLFIVSQFLRREKKFCKTELLNDLLLKQ